MISASPILTPPQIGAGSLPLASETTIMSARTATNAIRGKRS
jgi:hypothetical protein